LNNTEKPDNIPTITQIEDFWSSILSISTTHNSQATWIQKQFTDYNNIPTQTEISITEIILKEALTSSQNWKAPGPDQIQNFWIKKFSATHKYLLKFYNSFLIMNSNIPQWMTTGVTYLLS
jgi:hypothetical protein